MIALLLGLVLHAPAAPAAPAMSARDSLAGATLAAQSDVRVAVVPEIVTVGQHFTVTVRVRAPKGATIQLPVGTSAPETVDTIGAMERHDTTFPGVIDASATYTLAAWEVGSRAVGLGDVVVQTDQGERRFSLATVSIFVRSVLPADTSKRVPKPARPPIQVVPFDWRPWLYALLAAIAIGIAAAIWAWSRRRAARPVAPMTWAEREFRRVEAMQLIESAHERHAILMAGVLRGYLVRRVAGVRDSATTRELAARVRRDGTVPYDRTIRLFERIDLIKFARATITRDDARAIGLEARAVVATIESAAQARDEALAKTTSKSTPPRAEAA